MLTMLTLSLEETRDGWYVLVGAGALMSDTMPTAQKGRVPVCCIRGERRFGGRGRLVERRDLVSILIENVTMEEGLSGLEGHIDSGCLSSISAHQPGDVNKHTKDIPDC
jgi:hypothetical protein